MGLEAQCTVRVGRKVFPGKALLEGERLVIRGDANADIPFDRMRDVTVDGDALVVRTDDTEARLELGAPMAERWSRLIKEPKGLFEKLEVGPDSRVAVVDVHDPLFLTALRERTASVAEGRVPEGFPVIVFGVESRDALRKIPLLRARMVDSGVLWVVRPKAAKAIAEGELVEALRAAGLAETKVVAFSKTHSAHRCVIPVELRGQGVRPRPPIVSIPPSSPALGLKKAGAGKAAKPAKAPKRTKPAKARPPARKAARKTPAKPKKRR